MVLQLIEDTLSKPEIRQNWQQTLNEWDGATPAQRAQAMDWIEAQRDEFICASHDVEDPGALDMLVAIRYIEMKSHWILMNTQINYALVRRGQSHPATIYRASLISQMLGVLEELIQEEDVDRILGFLAEPINRNIDSPRIS